MLRTHQLICSPTTALVKVHFLDALLTIMQIMGTMQLLFLLVYWGFLAQLSE